MRIVMKHRAHPVVVQVGVLEPAVPPSQTLDVGHCLHQDLGAAGKLGPIAQGPEQLSCMHVHEAAATFAREALKHLHQLELRQSLHAARRLCQVDEEIRRQLQRP